MWTRNDRVSETNGIWVNVPHEEKSAPGNRNPGAPAMHSRKIYDCGKTLAASFGGDWNLAEKGGQNAGDE
jgi:hypothetical protein